MILTTAQLQAIKADIAANPDLAALPNNGDGNQAVANLYNALASPTFIVWKTAATLNQVKEKFDGSELAGLTTANTSRLQTVALYSPMGVNPSLASTRVFFADVFSTGGITAAALLALWKRSALRIEKLFATGTGSDASPATLVVEGTINGSQILDARNS
jgi:hypothetical protein